MKVTSRLTHWSYQKGHLRYWSTSKLSNNRRGNSKKRRFIRDCIRIVPIIRRRVVFTIVILIRQGPQGMGRIIML